MWSTSYEPVIVGWNLRTGMVSCIIPTFKGVCAITPSPSVGSLIGFGGSDGWIRVIDFTKNYPAKSAAKPPGLTFRMKSKIMAVGKYKLLTLTSDIIDYILALKSKFVMYYYNLLLF